MEGTAHARALRESIQGATQEQWCPDSMGRTGGSLLGGEERSGRNRDQLMEGLPLQSCQDFCTQTKREAVWRVVRRRVT